MLKLLIIKTCLKINLLTTVMSDVPVLPDEDDEDAIPMLIDGPQCVGFGIFVIWQGLCYISIKIHTIRHLKLGKEL